ncbi:MAG: hypothetical protein ACT4QD_19835 [Acidobacteriota bacterium]
MREHIRRSAFVVCLLAMVVPLWGQAPPASNPWVQVTTVTVIPGASMEFEDYAKKIQAARTKLALPNAINVYQTMLGGNTMTYAFLVAFTDWAALDATPTIPALLAKAFGDAEGAKILKAGRSAISQVMNEVYQLRLDLSTKAKLEMPPAPFATLTVTEHHREAFGTYLRILGKIKGAEEQDPAAPTVLRYVLANGEGVRTIAARPSRTLAERGAWPNQGAVMVKAFGQGEWTDMSETIERSIASRSSVVVAHRPDLSTPANPATPSRQQ